MAETQSRLLSRDGSALVIIDVQEAYRGVTCEHERMLASVCKLIAAAALMGVPIVPTEQYPKGLGHLLSEVTELLPAGTSIVEKMSMSCCGAPGFVEALGTLERSQIVVAGIEAHACVSQTAHDLLARGYQVHVPRDAISSRNGLDCETGWQKMVGSGVIPTTVEMVCLEWVRTAAAPEFKALQKIIR